MVTLVTLHAVPRVTVHRVCVPEEQDPVISSLKSVDWSLMDNPTVQLVKQGIQADDVRCVRMATVATQMYVNVFF